MSETYARHGVRFQYPDDWELTEQELEEELAISVSGPYAGFWSLSLIRGQPHPEDVIRSVAEAFADEYEELDSYDSREQICERPTWGRDFEFFCNHLLNSAWARAFETDEWTVLLLQQATDQELAELGPIFRRITASLQVDDEPAEA